MDTMIDDTDTVIQTEDLTKVFAGNVAVDSLNIAVRRGELFGIVGPDGAGKTTIMRLLTAIMKPTSGNARVVGYPIDTEGEMIKEKIGYMSQRFGLYEDLTVAENIHFYADLYGVSRKDREARIDRLLSFSNLSPFQDRLAGNLSGGMKQKLGLACALIHTPEILFLDEPTLGVDPVSRRDFWKILYDLLKESITIFVSTAYLDEAERCTRVGLIYSGKMLLVEEPDKIRKSLPYPVFEIVSSHAKKGKHVIEGMAGVHNSALYGERLHIGVRDQAVLEAIKKIFVSQGIEVTRIRQVTPSLEDVFITMVDRQ